MIEYTGAPCNRVVAVFTGLAGRDMGIGFPNRIHIVVAILTTAGDIAVIESDAGPGLVRDMAVVARRIGLHMSGRFTRGGDTVMTACTGTGNDGVVKVDLRPTGG